MLSDERLAQIRRMLPTFPTQIQEIFYSHFYQAIRELLAEVERLRARVAELEAERLRIPASERLSEDYVAELARPDPGRVLVRLAATAAEVPPEEPCGE